MITLHYKVSQVTVKMVAPFLFQNIEILIIYTQTWYGDSQEWFIPIGVYFEI